MPQDLEAYRQRLRAAVQPAQAGVPATRMDSPFRSTQPPSLSHPDSGDFPYVETAELDQVPPERQSGGQYPQMASAGPRMDMAAPQGQETAAPVAPQGKQKIPVGPPGFKPKFDTKKLSKAQTAADVMGAMKPASKQTYLDWWEGQYGTIDRKWNAVMADIGQRPDARRKPSREEMFDMLLEFGLHMLKNSQNNDLGGALAKSVGGAVQGHYGRRFNEQARHDALTQQAREGRATDMKSIGTYGDALKGQAELDMRGAEQRMRDEQLLEAETRRKKLEGEAPETLDTDEGTAQWNPETRTWDRATMDGKQITRKTVQGSGTGRGGGRDTRTANQKNIDDLVDRGVPEQLATDIVYRRVKDWNKAFIDIVRDRMRNFASREEAESDAEEIIGGIAGKDWRKQPTNARISKDDPLGLR
jgi:hypothetical protein